jgi:hypothetical protein
MFRAWAVPYGIAMAILAPLILVADVIAWGRGVFWAIFAVVLVATLLLHFWMEDREIARREGRAGRSAHQGVR